MYLVFTKGDVVGKVARRADLIAFLKAVDSPAKAWLVASVADYDVDCSAPWIRADGDSWLLVTQKQLSDCPIQYADVLLRVRKDGTTEEVQKIDRPATGACAGRRPPGLEAASATSARSELGRYLATMAHLEAASVDAFQILREELKGHGAPRSLLRDLGRAAADETRHARTMARLARTHGQRAKKPRVTRGAPRSLEDIALDNAREGCVREMYGALEATWQAQTAADPELRRAMTVIAEDETRHAALSMRLAAWLDTKLDDEQRKRIDETRRAAFESLSFELSRRPDRQERLAGIPSASQATTLLASLQATL